MDTINRASLHDGINSISLLIKIDHLALCDANKATVYGYRISFTSFLLSFQIETIEPIGLLVFTAKETFSWGSISPLRERRVALYSYGLILPRLEPGGGPKIPQATWVLPKTNKKNPKDTWIYITLFILIPHFAT